MKPLTLAASYDYIIVGAGVAGCVLAHNLSLDPSKRVLLLEAGGADRGLTFAVPMGYAQHYFHPRTNWGFHSEVQSHLDDRRIYVPRGKVLGGSGSINAMIYVRGLAQDFDAWQAAGNPGWGYDAVLPYFKKIESYRGAQNRDRGTDGLIGVSSQDTQAHAFCRHFFQACAELGLPHTADMNGTHSEGASYYQVNIDQGVRSSSSRTYLRLARHRPNLTVMTDTWVERIVFGADKRAIGVQVLQHGQRRVLGAQLQVLLAAGAIGSPLLLQCSGVGDAQHLQRLGIALEHHLPSVGQHLQDHACVCLTYEANTPTLNDSLRSPWGLVGAALRYALTRRGPLALSVNQAGGFFKSHAQAAHPDMQLYFNPLSYQNDHVRKRLQLDAGSGFLLAFSPCRLASRGTVTLQPNAAMPNANRLQGLWQDHAVAIDLQLLREPQDLALMRQALRWGLRLMDTAALRSVTASPTQATQTLYARGRAHAQLDLSDATLDAYIRSQASSIYHLCGTCAMGPDARTSVVDASLKVHGLQGLRVIDASIFPNITSGNIQAPTLMVAEKASAMLRAEMR